MSVLTEEKYFSGSIEDLVSARHVSSLPVLRKDFIVHEYQIWESRLIGADAILLIAAILEQDELVRFASLASDIGLEILFEAHTEEEIERILEIEPAIVGINNRDLTSFTVDLATTELLRGRLPDNIVCISESGIKTHEDMVRLHNCGIDAVLIGEGLVTDGNPAGKLRELRGEPS
jgi:indole-3-glycerol phosphate synthase